MKTFIFLTAFAVLFKGIEPLPASRSRSPFIRSPSRNWMMRNNNFNNGPAFRSTRNGCPSVTMIGNNMNVIHKCVNGELYVNNEIVKGVKPTDNVQIISNDLKVNGKFIRHISTSLFGDDDEGKKNGKEENGGAGGVDKSTSRNSIVRNVTFNNGPAFDSTRNGCPSVTMIGNNVNVIHKCVNGELYVNNEIVKGVKPTDNVQIISNDLKINDKFIRHISTSLFGDDDDDEEKKDRKEENDSAGGVVKSPSRNSIIRNVTFNNGPASDSTKKGCPSVTMIGNNMNVIHKCINGELYVNNEIVKGVKPTDNVQIISNDLKVNDKFIRHISTSLFGDDDDDEEKKDVKEENGGDNDHDGVYINYNAQNNPPPVNMNFTNGVSVVRRNGKLFINGTEQQFKPTDKISIEHNNLYVNGKFIRYIEPKFSFY